MVFKDSFLYEMQISTTLTEEESTSEQKYVLENNEAEKHESISFLIDYYKRNELTLPKKTQRVVLTECLEWKA